MYTRYERRLKALRGRGRPRKSRLDGSDEIFKRIKIKFKEQKDSMMQCIVKIMQKVG